MTREEIEKTIKNGESIWVPYGYLGKWNATEANFYKAYDECVRLFRSEE